VCAAAPLLPVTLTAGEFYFRVDNTPAVLLGTDTVQVVGPGCPPWVVGAGFSRLFRCKLFMCRADLQVGLLRCRFGGLECVERRPPKPKATAAQPSVPSAGWPNPSGAVGAQDSRSVGGVCSNLRGDIVVSAVRGKCGLTFPARLGDRVRDGIRALQST